MTATIWAALSAAVAILTGLALGIAAAVVVGRAYERFREE